MLNTDMGNWENASIAAGQPPYTVLLPNDSKLRKFANQVNQLCKEKGLPPAFIDENGASAIDEQAAELRGSTDYQFAGWGVVAFPPNLQCWVHYKVDSPQHITVGRILVPLDFDHLIQLITEKFGKL